MSRWRPGRKAQGRDWASIGTAGARRSPRAVEHESGLTSSRRRRGDVPRSGRRGGARAATMSRVIRARAAHGTVTRQGFDSAGATSHCDPERPWRIARARPAFTVTAASSCVCGSTCGTTSGRQETTARPLVGRPAVAIDVSSTLQTTTTRHRPIAERLVPRARLQVAVRSSDPESAATARHRVGRRPPRPRKARVLGELQCRPRSRRR
jgi:hypothetical protein